MSIWGLSNLLDLSLCNNKLVGQVPSEIRNLRFLNFLSLSDNLFTGMILDSIIKLQKISYFNLSNNVFMGLINVFIFMLLRDMVLTLNVLGRRGMEFDIEARCVIRGKPKLFCICSSRASLQSWCWLLWKQGWGSYHVPSGIDTEIIGRIMKKGQGFEVVTYMDYLLRVHLLANLEVTKQHNLQ